MVERELLQVRIGLGTLVVAVQLRGVVAGADAGAAYVEVHGLGREEIVYDGSAFGVTESTQHVGGSFSDGCANAEDLLPLRRGVELNGVGGDLLRFFPCEGSQSCMTLGAEAAPHFHFAVALECLGHLSSA